MRLPVIVLLVSGAILPHALTAQIPVPGADIMVWQQGVNGSAQWKQLGCPRAYDSDADRDRMIRSGQCLNANPDGTPRHASYAPDDSPMWQRLGCPHDYESDAEKDQMIRQGLCRNAR